MFHNVGYERYSIFDIPNTGSPHPTPVINPFSEMIRLESSNMFDRKSKLIKYMHELKKSESWRGVPGFAGRHKKYFIEYPRAFTAIPSGNKTIVSVSSVSRMSYEQRYSIEELGKKVKTKIVAPSMNDLDTVLGILSQLTYLIKHIGYTIETHGNFLFPEILDSIKGISLEMPSLLMQES